MSSTQRRCAHAKLSYSWRSASTWSRRDAQRVRLRFKSAWKDGAHSGCSTHSTSSVARTFRNRLCTHPAAALSHAALPLVVQRHRACRPLSGPRRGRSRTPLQTKTRRPNRRRAAALIRARTTAIAASAPLTSSLLRRVFAIDIMTCPHCQGAMRVKSIATEADDIRAILRTVPRARPPPPPLRQLELDLAAA
jgi:hypothetical protein